MNQTELIAKHLVDAYPHGVCSQGIDRDIALQLPRVINNFKFELPWQFGEDSIISNPCSHIGKKRAVDYTLTPKGLSLFVGYYGFKKVVGDSYVLPTYLKPQASNQIVQPSIEPEYTDRTNLVPVEKEINILGRIVKTISWEPKQLSV